MVLFNTDIIRETIEVSTIVADDQFAETIDKGKVTIAVQTTYVFRTDGDEVAMIDVTQSSCSVAKDSVGVYENLVTTHRYIATCKDCIVDVDTRKIKFAPVRCICCLVTQCIQIVNGDIFSLCKVACAAALLVIPETITSINDYAFNGCSKLTSVTIPNSVTSIGTYALSFYDDFTDLYCYAEQVPSTKKYAFSNSICEYATLHVPANSIEAYKNAEQWRNFGNIVALTDPSGIESTTATQQPTVVECYTIDGKRINQPQRGLNIIKMNDGTTRKVVVK